MENIVLSQDLSAKIEVIIKSFLQSQLGENAIKINSFINNDILVIYAHDILSPAEQQMFLSDVENKLLIEYKLQQFESVKADLIQEVGDKTGLIIKNVQTIITKDCIRIINFTVDNQN